MRFVVFSLVVGAIAAACTSFSEGDDAPSTPTGDASPPEGGPEGATTGGGGDAGGCKRVIDEKMAAMLDWAQEVHDGGSVFFVGDDGVDGPGALGARVTPTSAYGQARVEIDRLPLPKSVRLSYALRIVQAGSPSNQFAEIGCRLQLRSAEGLYAELGTNMGSGELEIDDQINPGPGYTAVQNTGALVGPLKLNAWQRVVLTFAEITPTTAKALGSVDETQYFAGDVTLPAPAERVRIKCGIDYADEGVDAILHVDDITLDFCE
jgi:hypothetical protein